jgi:hypothetical protein
MAGPYRIRYRPRGGDLALAEAAGAPPAEEFQSYLDRLLRMIPTEVVALYLVGIGIIPPGQRAALLVWSLVCLAAVVALRTYGSRDEAAGRGPQWQTVMISAIAFVVWLYSLGGPFAAYNLHVPYVGSLLVLAWTFFVPLFYKGEPALPAGPPGPR